MTPSPLISVTGLADLLAAGAPVTVLDVRYQLGGPSGPQEFAAGHVPGARFVDLEDDLADPPGPEGRHPLPEPEAFGAAMRRLGVSSSVPVVLYDGWGARAAARAWWLLRHHGHDDVRVLDGGWKAWQEQGEAPEVGEGVRAAAGDFRPGPGRLAVVGAEEVPDVEVLIDARNPERYRGEVEPVDPVAGHIPSAVNVATGENLTVHGTFRPPYELARIYAAAGVSASVRAAVYCGSGVTACHDVLALNVAGLDAALYPGSWSGWVADPQRPVATGPAS